MLDRRINEQSNENRQGRDPRAPLKNKKKRKIHGRMRGRLARGPESEQRVDVGAAGQHGADSRSYSAGTLWRCSISFFRSVFLSAWSSKFVNVSVP